ncbi:MAG: hypothetical protein Q8J78_16950 [Moraxellaceae bacterium]|nr:hypothetical protein [Moraxellaceae bacterium]
MKRIALLLTLLSALPFASAQAATPEIHLPVIDGFRPGGNPIGSSLLTADGSIFWATNNHQLKAWDTRSGRQLHDEGITNVSLYMEGAIRANLRFNGALGGYPPKYLTAVSPDGRFVGFKAWLGDINNPPCMVWDAKERRMLHTNTGLGTIYGFSPDGRWMIVKGLGVLENRKSVLHRTGAIEVREVLTGTVVKTLAEDGNAFVAADGSQLVLIEDNKRRLFTFPYDKGQKLGKNDRTPFKGYSNTGLIGDSGLQVKPTEKTLRIEDAATGALVSEYPLVANPQQFYRTVAALLPGAQRDADAAKAKADAALDARIAGRPADYQTFLANFNPLPNAWALDYNTLQGRDITGYAWTRQHWGTFFSGQTFNAVGKVAECANASVALLTLTRSQRNGADTSTFQLSVLDVDGKLLGNHDIGLTQKDASGRPLVVAFVINSTTAESRIDIRQARWDGDQQKTLTLNRQDCSVR